MSAQGPSATGAEGSDTVQPEGDPLHVRLEWPGAAFTQSDGHDRDDEREDEQRLAEVATVTTPTHGDVVLPGSSVSMLVDAYERLGGRVLSRLGDLREDTDATMAELRSEVSGLRVAIEDVADRIQLRRLHTAVDEVRNDLAALRAAVLEQPELERIAHDVSALRAASADLLETAQAPGEPRGPESAADVAPALQEQLDAVSEELAGLREEMVTLRRRIALRAESRVLRPEELEAIADAVAQQVFQKLQPAATRPS